MYARITRYKMKPEATDAAIAQLNQMKSQIMALPGMIHFVNSMNADGSGYVVSLVESQEISDANQESVAKIWAAFADYLESQPEGGGYNVVANWSN